MPNPICPTDCNADIPVVEFDRCNPEIYLSEIVRIFIAKNNTTPFTNYGQAAEWTTRLSETNTTGDDYIRPLTVIADKPQPSENLKQISGDRELVLNKTHIINWTIDETNARNHDFLRQIECGGEFKMWYETSGGKMFGGNEGITCRIKGDMILARGTEEHEVYNGTCKWKSKFTEEFVMSPIAL